MIVTRAVAALLLSAGLAAGCSSSSSTPPPTTTGTTSPVGGFTVPLDATGGSCLAGETACAASGPCCASGSTCAPNPSNVLGCGASETFCCLSCGSGSYCGAGCCPSGSQCTSGGDCGATFCCGPVAPADECPAYVASTCPGGTTCLANHSARACGSWACYLPSGGVACPGEFACPDGVSFCPSGTDYCAAVSGVCLTGSVGADNWCCKTYADIGQACDTDNPCHPGSSCVPNNGCPGSDPYAASVCYGPCGVSFPVDCGSFCCSSSYPVCGGAGTCMCYTF